MIIVQLNRQIFEYDVHSLVKSFYPGEDVKIVYETSPEEADAQLVCRLEFLKTVSNFNLPVKRNRFRLRISASRFERTEKQSQKKPPSAHSRTTARN